MQIQADAITNVNAAQVAGRVAAAIRAGDRRVDFTGVVRCDTAAIACVLAWMRIAHAAGGRLELIAVPPDLMSMAKLYGVAELVTTG
jgi:phospholipid transport system transporter-binding protein